MVDDVNLLKADEKLGDYISDIGVQEDLKERSNARESH